MLWVYWLHSSEWQDDRRIGNDAQQAAMTVLRHYHKDFLSIQNNYKTHVQTVTLRTGTQTSVVLNMMEF